MLNDRVTFLTKKLREEYYDHADTQIDCDVVPFGGSIKESIGPFPEFILKGRFCKRSKAGLCSPCFYSRLPKHDISADAFNNGYLQQIDYIVDNFEKLVVDNQIGKVAFAQKTAKPIYALVCTPTGSYFDAYEYPVEIRKLALKKLVDKATEVGCELALHIESHAEDVICYFQAPDDEELKLLKKLNARVILGFESVNEVARNILYAKNLDLDRFMEAVNLLKNNGFPVGAFVFAGLFVYNETETIKDVTNTLYFLKQNEIMPVLMFANVQQYTISDVLMEGEKFKLLDSHTVLIIVKIMLEIFGCSMDGKIDPWLIADPMGGPPEPQLHIFNAETNTACKNCAAKSYEAIENLRITKDASRFLTDFDKIFKHGCVLKYEKLIAKQEEIAANNTLEKRIEKALDYVESHLENYVLKLNPWMVKAELLCYGLCLLDEQMYIAKKFNPFICETGLIHAVHIKYKGMIINVCVAEKFCRMSPYSAKISSGGVWELYKNDKALGEFEFIHLPNWVNGTYKNYVIGEIIRPHSDSCVSLWASLNCGFINQGKACKFCGLISNEKKGVVMSADDIAAMIDLVFKEDKVYEINISGGTCGDADSAIDYYSSICKRIREKYSSASISVECAPPVNNEKLYQLHDAGVSAIIMNLEIYDDKIRKEVCPGKIIISRDRYFEAFNTAVSIFGRGNVSSVLIVGLQPIEDVMTACKAFINMGVVPTLMPFKPLDGTEYEMRALPNVHDYVEATRYSTSLMRTKHLCIADNSGCASCGGCSLEIDLTEKF